MTKFKCQPETWARLFYIWAEEHAGERAADLTEFASIDKSESWLADAVVHTLIRPVHTQWEVAFVFADPLNVRHFLLVPFFTVDTLEEARYRARQMVGPHSYPFSLSAIDMFDSWN